MSYWLAPKVDNTVFLSFPLLFGLPTRFCLSSYFWGFRRFVDLTGFLLRDSDSLMELWILVRFMEGE